MGEEGEKTKDKGHTNSGYEVDEKETKVDVKDDLDDDAAEEYPFKFSWKMLWLFTGPGWLMSIAYLDPGNIEADLQSGVVGEYKLLWVLLWATVVGGIMQRLSARIGIVSGKHLAEVCQENLLPIPNFLLWVMVEIAVIGSDMQEVIGTSLALYLLTDGWLKIPWGCLITIVDTFTFLFLERYGRRKLEYFFAFLIAVMALSFGINYGRDLPDQGGIALGSIIPSIPNKDALLQAVGAAGAVIMPHNFYLHSGLVSSRKINRKSHSALRDANFYTTVEGNIALAVSFLISLVVIAVFGHGLYDNTHQEVFDMCKERDYRDFWTAEFNCSSNANDACWSEPIDSSIYTGGIWLGCAFGAAYCYIWAVGILASGQASTMTGTYAGQFCMQGFLKLRWAQWKVLVVTRLTAMAPTLLVAFFTDIPMITTLNDYLNAVMFIMLPFAVVPCLAFSSSRLVMKEFKSGLPSKILSCGLSLIIVAINFYFLYGSCDKWIGDSSVYWWIPVGIFFLVYLSFVIYLSIYMLICLGWESLAQYPMIQRYYIVDGFLEDEEKNLEKI
eukprot:GFUD01007160.1.p1 GENE.GFUD01007160.1~~GFUD01007160.1.p1  ORF type:complete len:556 (+),score=105.63 GFUD01007160.1:38-1705(+)